MNKEKTNLENETPALSKGAVTCPFAFGEWLLIDGVTSGQYIQPATQHTHTVDINGIWGEFTLDRLKKDYNYRSANGR